MQGWHRTNGTAGDTADEQAQRPPDGGQQRDLRGANRTVSSPRCSGPHLGPRRSRPPITTPSPSPPSPPSPPWQLRCNWPSEPATAVPADCPAVVCAAVTLLLPWPSTRACRGAGCVAAPAALYRDVRAAASPSSNDLRAAATSASTLCTRKATGGGASALRAACGQRSEWFRLLES